MLFLTFAVNITQVGFESFFPRKLSATNRAFLFDSCRLFLHRVNSHNYLNNHQNMDPKYPPSKRREPVKKDRTIFRASLETVIGQVSGFSLLKDPRDHARDRKQRKLHLAPIFECTFHRLTALASSCFLLLPVLLNITLLKMGFIVVQWENENSVSVLNEKKVVGAVELKEGTINS